MNGSSSLSASSAGKAPAHKVLRARYKEAARSFINTDFHAALCALSVALQRLQPAAGTSSWIDLLDAAPGSAELSSLDLRRKILILYATLIATCYASQDGLPSETKTHDLLGPILVLKADAAASRLYDRTLSYFDNHEGITNDGELPLPTSGTSRLPPSVAVSLALSALKMGAPKAAKATVDAWLGSIDERAEAALEAEGETYDTTPESSLTSSALSLSTPSDSSGSPRRDALMSYERLLEVYALHILPALDAWDEAEEWVKLLAKENGGYARRGKVEWLTTSLQDTKTSHAEELQQERQRALAQAEQEKHEKELRRHKAKKSSGKRRGINGSASDEHSSSSASSPPKLQPPTLMPSPPPPDPEPVIRRQPQPVSGFAAMRSALADFLRPRPPRASVIGPHEGALMRLSRFMSHQGRLLSLVVFAFSIVAWRRRARRTAGETARDFWEKLKATVGMATTTSYL